MNHKLIRNKILFLLVIFIFNAFVFSTETHAATPKLQEVLAELQRAYLKKPSALHQIANSKGITITNNKVTVYLIASGKNAGIIDQKALKRYGVEIQKSFGNVIRANVPVSNLQAIANKVKGVSFVQLTGISGTSKIQNVLRELERRYIQDPQKALNYAIAQGISEIFGNKVRVYLTASGDTFRIIDRTALSALGVNIEKTFGNTIRALVPIDKLQAIANQVTGIANIQLTKALAPFLTDQQISAIAQGLLGPQATAVLEAMGIGIGSMLDCCSCPCLCRCCGCPFC